MQQIASSTPSDLRHKGMSMLGDKRPTLGGRSFSSSSQRGAIQKDGFPTMRPPGDPKQQQLQEADPNYQRGHEEYHNATDREQSALIQEIKAMQEYEALPDPEKTVTTLGFLKVADWQVRFGGDASEFPQEVNETLAKFGIAHPKVAEGGKDLWQVRRKDPKSRPIRSDAIFVKALQEYSKRLLDLIECERAADRQAAEKRRSAINPSPDEGLSLFDVRLVPHYSSAYKSFRQENMITFDVMPVDGTIPLLKHAFKRSHQVSITEYAKGRKHEDKDANEIKAFVTHVSPTSMQVEVQAQDAALLPEKCRIDLPYIDVVYQRMADAVHNLSLALTAQRKEQAYYDSLSDYSNGRKRTSLILAGTDLADLIIPELHKTAGKMTWRSDLLTANEHLNSWIERHLVDPAVPVEGDPECVANLNPKQLQAIAVALRHRISLIQGPPGTGKSALVAGAVHLLKHFHKISMPILICAPTNAAVDHLTKSMAKKGLKPLRIGHSSKIREDCIEYSYGAREQLHPSYMALASARAEEAVHRRNLQAHGYTRDASLPKSEVSEFDAFIKSLATAKLQEEVRSFAKALKAAQGRAGHLYYKIREDIFKHSDVVLCTAIGASNSVLNEFDFPLVFIDEAAQCNHASSLVPLMRSCEQLVLIGDHKQLQSICISPEAEQNGFNRSLFEDMMEKTDCPRIMLEEQYRMPFDIVSFSNEAFYGGKLRTARPRPAQIIQSSFIKNKRPVVFLDHRHSESRSARSKSNIGEAGIIADVLVDLFEKNPQIRGSDIGIIAPYIAQTDLLLNIPGKVKLKLPHRFDDAKEIEIKTVDGFQGREKQCIIISTVRSNEGGHVGFLDNPRRLNVALTRAQSLLIVIGNADTLAAKEHVWAEYIGWLDKCRLIRSWPSNKLVAPRRTTLATEPPETRSALDQTSMQHLAQQDVSGDAKQASKTPTSEEGIIIS